MPNVSKIAQPIEAGVVQTNLRLREDLKKRAEHWCIDHDTNLSALCNRGLELILEDLESGETPPQK